MLVVILYLFVMFWLIFFQKLIEKLWNNYKKKQKE